MGPTSSPSPEPTGRVSRATASWVTRAWAEVSAQGQWQDQSLVTVLDHGVCTVDLIVDKDGQPIDYAFLDIDAAFAHVTGLDDVVSKPMREVLPGLEESWYETCNRVVQTGVPERFEVRAAALDRWFHVYAYRVGQPGDHRLAISFENITARKRAELRHTLLVAISHVLLTGRDIAPTLIALGEVIGHALDVQDCVFSEVGEGCGTCATVHAWHAAEPLVSVGSDWAWDLLSDTHRARITGGEPVLVTDIQADPRISTEMWRAPDVRSFIIVPFVHDGYCQLRLSIMDNRPRRWQDNDIVLLQEIARDIWHWLRRVQAEHALRESEERFRSFAEHSTDTLWIVDTERGCLDYLSPAFEQMWGEARAAVLHEPGHWIELVHPADRSAVLSAKPSAHAGEEAVRDYRIVRRDGEVRWIQDTGFAIRDANSGVYRVAGIAHDVTEQKQALEALRQSEERFRLIVEQATDYAIFATDPDRRIETWTPGAEAVFGWTADEAIGQRMDIIYTPEDQATGIPEHDAAFVSEQGPARTVHWHQRANGSRVCIEGATYPRRDAEGALLGLFKVGQDVTSRLALEDARRQSEAMLSTVLQAAPVAIGFFDANGQVLLANLAMQRYLPTGVLPSRDPIGGDHWTAHNGDGKLLLPHEYPGALALRGRATVPGLEMCYRPEDGPEVWTRVSAFPLHDGQGQVTRLIIVITDVDALKRTAETLRQSEASLQQRVCEATSELRTLSRQLLLVQEEERRKLALELHDEIGQVLTGLTFQLAAARAGRNETALDEANATVQRLTAQVRELALDLRPQVLDTHGLLAAVEWYLVHLYHRTGITVHLSHEHLAPRYPADVEIAAFRVIQEAMTNVARYAGVSEAWVTLFGESHLLVVISDLGRGFTPSPRLSSSGLGGMRERVTLLGGTFTLESAPGAGVQITAEFPLQSLPEREGLEQTPG